MIRRLYRAASGDAGQGLAEYALILALVALVAIVGLVLMDDQVRAILSAIGTQV